MIYWFSVNASYLKIENAAIFVVFDDSKMVLLVYNAYKKYFDVDLSLQLL